VHRWLFALLSLLLLATAGPAGAPPIEAAPHPEETRPSGPEALGASPLGINAVKRDYLAPPPGALPSEPLSARLRSGRFEDVLKAPGQRQSLTPDLRRRFGDPVTLPDNSKAYHVGPNLLVREAEITDAVVGYLNTDIDGRRMVFAGYFDRSLDDYRRVAQASDGSFVDLGETGGDPASLLSRNAGRTTDPTRRSAGSPSATWRRRRPRTACCSSC